MSSRFGKGNSKDLGNVITKKSSSVVSWQRLRTACQVLRETEENVTKLKLEIEEGIGNSEQLTAKEAEVQAARISTQSLEKHLELYRKRVLAGKARITKARIVREQAAAKIQSFQESIDSADTKINEKQSSYIQTRQDLLRCSTQLALRRRHLIEELQWLYRIQSDGVTPSLPGNKKMTPCNCQPKLRLNSAHIPPAESFAGHSDAEISVGIGEVAHLLTVIYRILDISPPYPIIARGSTSFISDFSSPSFRDEDRQVPLFSKRRENADFEYGVYLLNKDLTQLRTNCFMETTNRRLTLDNLKSLLLQLRQTKINVYMDQPIRWNASSGGGSVSETDSGSGQDRIYAQQKLNNNPSNIIPSTTSQFSNPRSVNEGGGSDESSSVITTATSVSSYHPHPPLPSSSVRKMKSSATSQNPHQFDDGSNERKTAMVNGDEQSSNTITNNSSDRSHNDAVEHSCVGSNGGDRGGEWIMNSGGVTSSFSSDGQQRTKSSDHSGDGVVFHPSSSTSNRVHHKPNSIVSPGSLSQKQSPVP